jgi:hypothetical protein
VKGKRRRPSWRQRFRSTRIVCERIAYLKNGMRRRAGKDLREIKVSATRFGAVSVLDADGISNYEGVTFSSKHNINAGWG